MLSRPSSRFRPSPSDKHPSGFGRPGRRIRNRSWAFTFGGVPKPTPQHIQDAMVDAYLKGVPIQEICATYGTKKYAIYSALERRGIDRARPVGARRQEWTEEELARIAELRASRATLDQIQQAMGAGEYRVTRAVKELERRNAFGQPGAGKPLTPRELAEQVLGRRLRSDEHVLHRNGDTTDNRLINLVDRRRWIPPDR